MTDENKEKYLSYLLGCDASNLSGEAKKRIIEEKYDIACKRRDFEISNYWKRTNYFWLFQAAAFTAYYNVFIKAKDDCQFLYLLFGVICIGFIVSLSWCLVNKGSKYWQENWEHHVVLLEEYFLGSLHALILKKTEKDETSKRFSVSKINYYVSKYCVGIWVILFIDFILKHVLYKIILCEYFSQSSCVCSHIYNIITCIITGLIGLLFFGWTLWFLIILINKCKSDTKYKSLYNLRKQDVQLI